MLVGFQWRLLIKLMNRPWGWGQNPLMEREGWRNCGQRHIWCWQKPWRTRFSFPRQDTVHKNEAQSWDSILFQIWEGCHSKNWNSQWIPRRVGGRHTLVTLPKCVPTRRSLGGRTSVHTAKVCVYQEITGWTHLSSHCQSVAVQCVQTLLVCTTKLTLARFPLCFRMGEGRHAPTQTRQFQEVLKIPESSYRVHAKYRQVRTSGPEILILCLLTPHFSYVVLSIPSLVLTSQLLWGINVAIYVKPLAPGISHHKQLALA